MQRKVLPMNPNAAKIAVTQEKINLAVKELFMKQLVLLAVTLQKFLSNPVKTVPFIAQIALQNKTDVTN
jgi:hypothetical protein